MNDIKIDKITNIKLLSNLYLVPAKNAIKGLKINKINKELSRPPKIKAPTIKAEMTENKKKFCKKSLPYEPKSSLSIRPIRFSSFKNTDIE